MLGSYLFCPFVPFICIKSAHVSAYANKGLGTVSYANATV